MSYIETAVDDYEKENYYGFGVQIGKASVELLQGKEKVLANQEQGKPNKPPKIDPKMAYAMKMGAEYAVGFLFGAGAGTVDD